MLDLCKTRWAERQGTYRHFYQAYVYITEASIVWYVKFDNTNIVTDYFGHSTKVYRDCAKSLDDISKLLPYAKTTGHPTRHYG